MTVRYDFTSEIDVWNLGEASFNMDPIQHPDGRIWDSGTGAQIVLPPGWKAVIDAEGSIVAVVQERDAKAWLSLLESLSDAQVEAMLLERLEASQEGA